ncbi:rod shape-determining protein MreD, partial [Vibrio parahaemolyticus V-223/04]
TSARR